MADGGFLGAAGGIGNGLSSFADAYMRSKQMQQQNDLNQQYVDIARNKEKAGLLAQGMEEDSNGNPQYNPDVKALKANQQKVALGQSNLDLQDIDPTSDNSKNTEKFFAQRLETAHPGSGQFVPSGQSAKYYKENFGEYVPEQEKFASTEKVAKLKGDEFLQGLGLKGQYQKELQDMKSAQQTAENDKKFQSIKEENDKKWAAQQKMLEERLNALNKKPNPAYQALDKDFAKDWNTYTNGGRATVDQNIDRLENAKQYLLGHDDATGSIRGLLPQSVRAITNPDSVKAKQDVQSAVIGGLKGAMGGRVTQQELNTFMGLAWNDQLSPAQNADKIDQVIEKIKTERENTERKGAEFEKNGTLGGMNQSQPTGFTPKASQRNNQQQAGTSKTAKPVINPGAIVNGMVFRGGNYKDKNNWSPAPGSGQ